MEPRARSVEPNRYHELSVRTDAHSRLIAMPIAKCYLDLRFACHRSLPSLGR